MKKDKIYFMQVSLEQNGEELTNKFFNPEAMPKVGEIYGLEVCEVVGNFVSFKLKQLEKGE